ncbi:deoxyribose-phosphate aldolase [Sabulilitoribacter arenilitoris]|uniref:Deoxyribose-phosphate aldolase n=1 Tax=Wocania arenilitoris TaxID=2044858 RepID=A0AAE3JLA0_9FLAO|nr:deoxyribose-phosphate aldolase [Wocania arenilitoris]MCF7567967.1 deoxyribose-phosphate aldolase [Wocania arenilitoris]
MQIASYIEYALLHPSATERDIIELCLTAQKNNYYAVNINSYNVTIAKQLLSKTNVKICTPIGFPLGSIATASKVYEAKQALSDGADEIEMVINQGLLKSKNYVSVLKDISDVKQAIGNTPLKAIIEISELNKNEVIRICEICLDAKVDYIKTSSGFSKNGATFTAVKIIKKTVRDHIKIAAFDGIEDYETAAKFLEVGADRVGINYDVELFDNKRAKRNSKIFKQYIKTAKEEDILKSDNVTEPV